MKETEANNTDLIFRRYEQQDRKGIRTVAIRTACRYEGKNVFQGLYDLASDYLTSYYTDYEPEMTWVATSKGIVRGYLLGCSDTKRYLRIMAFRIVPGILINLMFSKIGELRKNETARKTVRWFVLHSWKELAPIPIGRYPAHFHVNMIPGYHGRGNASRLLNLFLNELEKRGIRGIHFAVTESTRHGPCGELYRRYSKYYPARPSFFFETSCSFHRVVSESQEPMSNRFWGGTTDDMRIAVKFLERMIGI